MRRAFPLLAVLLALMAAGCTVLRVEKIEYAPDGTEVNPPPGIRYSLPKPVLKVVPRADGAIDVEVVYLPDQDHTYAIHAQSRAARHKLEIAIERGLLQRIAWNPDATSLPAQTVERSAAVAKTFLEERRRAEEEANAPFADAAPGPVFYAINERAGSPPTVSLVAAEIEPGEKQVSFKTVDLRRPAGPLRPALEPRGGVRPRLPLASGVEYRDAAEELRLAEVRLDTLEGLRGSASELRKAEVSLALARERMAIQRERAFRFEVDSSLPLRRLGSAYIDDVPACEIVRPTGTTGVRCFLKNAAIVVVDVPADLPGGSYVVKVNFVYRIGTRQGEGEAEIEFDVERAPR